MKTVLVYSGGMDSTTLLYKLLKEGNKVLCLSFDYGQRHRKELASATRICARLRKQGKKVMHEIVDIRATNKLMQGSALTSAPTSKKKIPEGHYESKTMKSTVVPNRNMIFMALAIAQAVSFKYDRIAIAVHAGDHAIYPDCRPKFVEAMRTASTVANYESIKIIAPFLNKTKREIAQIGRRLGVPFEDTWTCYKGLAKPCGKCGACIERTEALG